MFCRFIFIAFCLLSCKPLGLPWQKKIDPPQAEVSKGDLFLKVSASVLPQKNEQIVFEEGDWNHEIPVEKVYLLIDVPSDKQNQSLQNVLFPSMVQGKGQVILAVERKDLMSDEKLKAVLPESYQLEDASVALTKQQGKKSSPKSSQIKDVQGVRHKGGDDIENPKSIYTGVYKTVDGRGRSLYFEEVSVRTASWLKGSTSVDVQKAVSRVLNKLQLDGVQADRVIDTYRALTQIDSEQATEQMKTQSSKLGIVFSDQTTIRQTQVPSMDHIVVTRLGGDVFMDRWFAYTAQEKSEVKYISGYLRRKIAADGSVKEEDMKIQSEERKHVLYSFQTRHLFQKQLLKAYQIAPHLQYGDRDYAVALTLAGQVWHGFRRWAYRHRWLLTLATAGLVISSALSVDDFLGSSEQEEGHEAISLEENCMAMDWVLPECQQLLEEIQESYGTLEKDDDEVATDVVLDGIPLPNDTGSVVDDVPPPALDDPIAGDGDAFETTPVEGAIHVAKDAVGFLLNATTGVIDHRYRLQLTQGDYHVTGFFLKAGPQS